MLSLDRPPLYGESRRCLVRRGRGLRALRRRADLPLPRDDGPHAAPLVTKSLIVKARARRKLDRVPARVVLTVLDATSKLRIERLE